MPPSQEEKFLAWCRLHEKLLDAAWLRKQLLLHSERELAQELEISRDYLLKFKGYHGIVALPRRLLSALQDFKEKGGTRPEVEHLLSLLFEEE